MSEAENRAAPSSKWNMAILVAVLCGAAGFCIGLLLQTQIVDLLHNASHAPDSLLSAGKTLLLMFGVLSVAISLYASIPAAIAVGLLFKFRLGRWYHFVGAGLLTMFVSLLSRPFSLELMR